MRLRTYLIALATASALSAGLAQSAFAQQVTQRDISAELQAGLDAAAPTVVYFAFDKADLSAETRAVLDRQAVWLTANPNAKVDLAGHTDAVGSNRYNDALAMRRARSVEDYLLTRGVQPAQMRSVVSRGESALAVATERRERLNRRVSTSVTGLVDITLARAAPPPSAPPPRPAPPVRSYAESPLAVCAGDGMNLAGLDKSELRTALEGRLQSAASYYDSSAGLADVEGRFYQAAFAKSECGIAIGYLKKGIRDARSIANCDCFTPSSG